jgi:predicted GNAT family N-acyltransferase
MIRIYRPADPTACYALRHTVFVEEQNVPLDLERDALDDSAIHLLAEKDGVAMGTARIVVLGETGKIGRVCVLRHARGTGIGVALIEAALEELRNTPGIARAALGAQIDALGFYEKLGFVAYGPVFDDAGIDHRMMEQQLLD